MTRNRKNSRGRGVKARFVNEVNNVQQEDVLRNSLATDCPIMESIDTVEKFLYWALGVKKKAMEYMMKELEKEMKNGLMEVEKEIDKAIKHTLMKIQMKIKKQVRREVSPEEVEQLRIMCGDVETNSEKINSAQIFMPTFEGKEEDDVKQWLRQISHIAYAFKLNEYETREAAIKQLRGFAIFWFNRQSLKTRNQWKDLKLRLENHFNNDRAIYIASIKRRFWKIYDEKFIDYAKDKLHLMKGLPQQRQITLLINGIKNPKLRQTLLGKSFTSTHECINYVEKIINHKVSSAYFFKKQSYNQNKNADKRREETSCNYKKKTIC